VNSPLCITHTNLPSSISNTNSVNKGASPDLPSFSTLLPFSQTSATTQPAEVNLSIARQPAKVNMSMLHGQSMESSVKPMLEPLVILYNNNQPADPNLWNGLFASISLLGIDKFINSNVQNIMCLLLRIGTFIKQHTLSDKHAKDFLELANIGFIAWYLINVIYESG